jgi:hypothetical protein
MGRRVRTWRERRRRSGGGGGPLRKRCSGIDSRLPRQSEEEGEDKKEEHLSARAAAIWSAGFLISTIGYPPLLKVEEDYYEEAEMGPARREKGDFGHGDSKT